MKKIILIIALAMAIVTAASVSIFAYVNSSAYVFENSISDVTTEVIKRDELRPILDVLSSGSLDFKIKGREDKKKSVVSGKMYFGKEEFMLENFKVTDGTELLELDLYSGESGAYITNESILGGTYGFTYGTLAEEFKNSIFAYEKGDFSVADEKTEKAIIKLFELIDDRKRMDELSDDTIKVIEKYNDKAYKLMREYGELDSDNKKIKTGGEKVSARVLTLTLDSEAIANVLRDLYEEARLDEDVEKVVKELSDIIESMDAFEDVDEQAEDEKNDEPDTLMEYYEVYFADDKDDTISGWLDSVEEGNFEIEIETATSIINHTLMQASLDVSVGDISVAGSVDFGKKGIDGTDKIVLSFANYEIVYEIQENSKEKFEATLDLGKELGGKIELAIDKEDDKYVLSIFDAYEISGDYEEEKNETKITLEKLTDADGKDILKVDITLIFNKKDRMPKPINDYKSIFDVKEEDLKKWVEEATEKFGPWLEGVPDIPAIDEDDEPEDGDISKVEPLSGSYEMTANYDGVEVYYQFKFSGANSVKITHDSNLLDEVMIVNTTYIFNSSGTQITFNKAKATGDVTLLDEFAPMTFLRGTNYIILDGERFNKT